MSLLSVQWYSSALSMCTRVNLILPERVRKTMTDFGVKREGPIKVLYLLHGMSDDESIWCRRTSIERYAAEYNLAVVMPTTGLFWYTDVSGGQKWFTYIAEELPRLIEDNFPQISQRPEHTFAAGLSMGGYGALKLGLRGNGRFSHVASLSGALDIARSHGDSGDPATDAYFNGIFGTPEEATATFNDLVTAAEELEKAKRPSVYLWCGTEDFLYDHNVRMRDHLAKLGYALTYEESPGDHQWKYWDEKIQRVLTWLPL